MKLTPIRGRAIAILTVALCACLGAAGASAKQNRSASGLTIFAGSSMTTVLPQIDPTNTYSFGSTLRLRRRSRTVPRPTC